MFTVIGNRLKGEIRDNDGNLCAYKTKMGWHVAPGLDDENRKRVVGAIFSAPNDVEADTLARIINEP